MQRSRLLRSISGRISHRWKILLLLLLVAGAFYWQCLPEKLFDDPTSTVLQARGGELLSATISSDGQWRFPQCDSVPAKFRQAIIAFEDKRFYVHAGVDARALARAMRENIRAGKIVGGGSTLTMQVIRLSRKGPKRTLMEKFCEVVLATRLELRHSKDEILTLYASHAPFGGNVVGIEAASWRYFGVRPDDLSWAQAAVLAVLPNAPSLIHPGKNREALLKKRNRLLERLFATGVIDDVTLELAKTEPIPDQPFPLPRYANHLLLRVADNSRSGQVVRSTIDFYLQQHVEQILDDHHQRLRGNQVHNGAVLVLDVERGAVLAYAGNTQAGASFESAVDMIAARRSTGSILKPFLFAAALDEGKILSKTLLPDVPTIISGFSPKNFSHSYDGAVPADESLIRSLNIPAVHLLRDYRYEKFHSLLSKVGMTTLHRPPDHYGLSLILGGAEGTLWDITGMYASMARTLNHYSNFAGSLRYLPHDFHAPSFTLEPSFDSVPEQASVLSASAIFLTFEALKEVYRPGEESGWRHFSNGRNIAWKTGTSFGFRDGWAVGVTPRYAVGVWVGNADGEGRPGLTGTDAAAPLLFDVFSRLSGKEWFAPPLAEMETIKVCGQSGQRATVNCADQDDALVTTSGLTSAPCQYHRLVHLSPDLKNQVHDACAATHDMRHVSWFVLPPVQEYYFRKQHVSYVALPPYRKDCQAGSSLAMDMVYPRNHARLFIPRELDGAPGRSVFELAHRNPSATVYWHMDGAFVGSTTSHHQLAIHPPEGKHVLTVVDEHGESMERKFEVISKSR